MDVLATFLLIVLLGIGILLLFFGNRLASLGFALGATALALTTSLGISMFWELSFLMTAALGVILCVVAWLLSSILFRLWMGISTAILLAALAPAVFLIAQDPSLPLQAKEKIIEHATQETTNLSNDPISGQLAAGNISSHGSLTDEQKEHLKHQAHDIWQRNASSVRKWWSEKPKSSKRALGLASLFGAAIGLGIGLWLPMWGAALQGSTAGAVLSFIAVREIVILHWPNYEHWLPSTPRYIILTFIILACFGFSAQVWGDRVSKRKEQPDTSES